jgi:Rrf2 family transcriptional regulator, nitric oxide-sensitive transcriptional repressor
MRLTLFTDYSLRVLLYLGAHQDRRCSIAEVAKAYGISQNHLMKVVNELARAGYVESSRGRSGGIRLGRAPEDINIGAVVRHVEDGFDLVDCGSCIIAPACGMTDVLRQAVNAFLAVLDGYTLGDMLAKRNDFLSLFVKQEGVPAGPAAPASARDAGVLPG